MPPLNFSIDTILSNLRIKQLNEMQQASLQAHAQHADVVLLSATGSGKTLAFLLPILQLHNPAIKNTQALVIVPSRELALQIEQVFRSMQTGLKITCCYGGHLRETEENNLVQPPALIVGTPGRLADHIRRGNITTDSITTLVLDEFDKSLELGFQEEMSFIIGSLPAVTKRILTSATEAPDIPAFIGLNNPTRLNFLPAEGDEPNALAIKTVQSDDKDKLETLFRLICALGNRSTIIFCNHRDAVQRTSDLLSSKGIVNEFYHGALEQQQRDSALAKFRNGTANVLVTTDLASRGLDIPNIRYIIHYHLPQSEEIFTHRNGRTARMDASGTANLTMGPDEELPAYVNEVEEANPMPENIFFPKKKKLATLFFCGSERCRATNH